MGLANTRDSIKGGAAGSGTTKRRRKRQSFNLIAINDILDEMLNEALQGTLTAPMVDSSLASTAQISLGGTDQNVMGKIRH